MKKDRYIRGVTSLRLDPSKCNGCRMCETVCPHEVFAVSGGKCSVVEQDSCMECGACAMNCPTGALTVSAGVGCAAAFINSMTGVKGVCDCDCSGSCGGK
ncbi:MAG: mercury methylation ferredoxin HgcB [Candidatus Fermentibacteraceae bacterium]